MRYTPFYRKPKNSLACGKSRKRPKSKLYFCSFGYGDRPSLSQCVTQRLYMQFDLTISRFHIIQFEIVLIWGVAVSSRSYPPCPRRQSRMPYHSCMRHSISLKLWHHNLLFLVRMRYTNPFSSSRTGNADPESVELTAEDELRCIYRVTLPMKLSSCDLRQSRFNFRRQFTEQGGSTEGSAFSILHVSVFNYRPLSIYLCCAIAVGIEQWPFEKNLFSRSL